MSGIYIPGERIPDTLTAFWIFPDGYVRVFGKNGDEIRGREAISVPDHGRLGDLDKLKQKALIRSERRGRLINVTDMVISAYDIEAAPTVIPAEEGQ